VTPPSIPPDLEPRPVAPAAPAADRAHAGEDHPLLAAALSALIPGLGQAYEGRFAAAALLLVPVVLLAVGVGLVVGATTLPELAGSLVLPSTITVLLVANVALLLWRILAVVDAWRGGRRGGAGTGDGGRGRRAAGALGVLALIAILAFVSVPHALAGWYGASASSAVARIFTAEDSDPFDLPAGTPGPTLAADAHAIVDASTLPTPRPNVASTPALGADDSPSPSPPPLQEPIVYVMSHLQNIFHCPMLKM
jgi:hypothetical protein